MTIRVHFYSYFKELTGCPSSEETVADGATIDQLLAQLYGRFPKLTAMRNSTLIAVGVDYQGRSYVLKAGEEVSLFPPVQGG
jgi:molybdopterin converting factor small subunit